MTRKNLENSEDESVSLKEDGAMRHYMGFSKDKIPQYLATMVAMANTEGGCVVFSAKLKNKNRPSESEDYDPTLLFKVFKDEYMKRLEDEYVGKIECLFDSKKNEDIWNAVITIKKCEDYIVKISDGVILYWSKRTIKKLKTSDIVNSAKRVEIKKRMTFHSDTKLKTEMESSSVYHFASENTGKKYLYKYMTLDSFLRCIKSGNILFQEPSEWKDQFEKRFYTAKYQNLKLKDKFPKQVFATCMTETHDCEAPWKVYANENAVFGKCLEIEIKMSEFRQQIINYAANNGMDVYEGKMTYALNQDEIKKLHKKRSPFHNYIFHSFNLYSYLGLLLIKRPAFEYENEVRFFMVPNDTKKKGSKKEFVTVQWENIINEVRIDKSCTEGEKLVVKQFCESKGIKFVETNKTPSKNKNGVMEISMKNFDINSMGRSTPITIDKP